MKEEKNPFELFAHWYKNAESCRAIKDANAMNLATSSCDGSPSNRMVLLKDYSNKGFVFYTNLESRKGRELAKNPKVSLCFYWEALGRQVRIEGHAVRISDKEADEYFNSRPLKSRIGAWVSKQSRPMESFADLFKEVAEQAIKKSISGIHRPPFWSGYNVIPHTMEFWKKGKYRLHERILYQRVDDSWQSSLLYP